MTQINPPFDGSAPCPACQRGLPSGYLHNFLTRCDVAAGRIRDNKAFLRLVDMRSYGLPRELTVPHPASQEVLEVCRALMQAIEGIKAEHMTLRWTPEIRERVEALIPRAAAAADAFSPLREACHADKRHSMGEQNVLRSSGGSRWAGFVAPDYEAARYDYTVELVEDGSADITHEVCGAGLKLHDHFKANIAKDRAFYGKVWCPRCRGDVPFGQFKCAPEMAVAA